MTVGVAAQETFTAAAQGAAMATSAAMLATAAKAETAASIAIMAKAVVAIVTTVTESTTIIKACQLSFIFILMNGWKGRVAKYRSHLI